MRCKHYTAKFCICMNVQQIQKKSCSRTFDCLSDILET